MSGAIKYFRGDYYFLSNFYPSEVEYGGELYPTVEHAYQAAKTVDRSYRRKIQKCNQPAKAKELGKTVLLKDGWEQKKYRVMVRLLRQKFEHKKLRKELLRTGDRHIVHMNDHGDTLWGVCRGQGYNLLGLAITQVRKEIQHGKEKKNQDVRVSGKTQKSRPASKARRRVNL